MSKVEEYIISIPDYPKPGIIFRDITSVLRDADGLRLAVDEMTALLDGVEFDAIAGLESRGFLFGAPMAYNLHKAFIPIRKQGKLPRATSRMSYELEYGMETIEVHRDDIKPGMKIVVVDDLIATGGTLLAAARLAAVADADDQRIALPVKVLPADLTAVRLQGIHTHQHLTFLHAIAFEHENFLDDTRCR